MTSASAGPSRIEVSIDDGIATLALNRPEVRNAIDDRMRDELEATLERVANDDAVRAVVLTGKGSAFCAGGDIAGMQQRLKAPAGQVAFNGWRRQVRLHRIIGTLHKLPKPTVAAVNGAAAGLGCDLALCCDFIIASEAAISAVCHIAGTGRGYFGNDRFNDRNATARPTIHPAPTSSLCRRIALAETRKAGALHPPLRSRPMMGAGPLPRTPRRHIVTGCRG